MRRADRLFQIVQLLRRRRTVTTAAHIAGKLEISERTGCSRTNPVEP
jgi:predicted DNA-binding transcriptional regulator YafY